ncbi:hypothetical protein GJ496_011949 [Pomphorhynchus laevis]|nr:hypothetical protein GJ496_011949 [Pomphorhynchus laevis]
MIRENQDNFETCESDAIEFNVLSRPKRSSHSHRFTAIQATNLPSTDESDVDFDPTRVEHHQIKDTTESVKSTHNSDSQTAPTKRRKISKRRAKRSNFLCRGSTNEFDTETKQAVEWLRARYPGRTNITFDTPHIIVENIVQKGSDELGCEFIPKLTIYSKRIAYRKDSQTGNPTGAIIPAKQYSPAKEKLPTLSSALFGGKRVSRNILQSNRELQQAKCALCNVGAMDGFLYGPYMHNNKVHWFHDVCAVWTPPGCLQIRRNQLVGVENIDKLLSMDDSTCLVCSKNGACVKCTICEQKYHFRCALNACILDWQRFTARCLQCNQK